MEVCDQHFAMRRAGAGRWVYEKIPFEQIDFRFGEGLIVQLDRVVKCEVHNRCWEIRVFK